MKHWDGRDRDDVGAELPHVAMPPAWRSGRLSPREVARLERMFAAPPRPSRPPRSRREPPHIGSVIGLVLALGTLAGVAWLLAPAEAVSSKILN